VRARSSSSLSASISGSSAAISATFERKALTRLSLEEPKIFAATEPKESI
jgi:hypothetical protein